jgi:hypothetical protein
MYPMRLTRNIWNIPLYAVHECSEQCEQEPGITHEGHGGAVGCPFRNKILKTEIHINSFNKNEPRGLHGKLQKHNEIVIPDKEIDMIVSFPLHNYVNMHIISSKENFSLSEILHGVKISYLQIYLHEEITASPRTFILDTNCFACNMNIVKNSVNQSEKPYEENVCSICCENFENTESGCVLSCDHCFHKECLHQWIDCNKRTCPNCRDLIFKCGSCGGDGLIQYEYDAVVLPYELRSRDFPFRNCTNGIYGIYFYDLEELFLQKMVYDRINKKLYITVGI